MKVFVQVEQRAGCFLCCVVLIKSPGLTHYCKERESSMENERSMSINISYTEHCECGG